MKPFYLLFLFITLFSCKKESPNPIEPDQNEEIIEQPPISTPQEHLIIDGDKFDNQRISIPKNSEISFETKVFISLVDTVYKIPNGNIEWSILAPENDSINAKWIVDSGIELNLSNSKKWIYKEQMWRYYFKAEIDKVSKNGSANIGIVFKNVTKNDEITRDTKVNVQLKEFRSEFNGADFGMEKSLAISSIQKYFQDTREYKPEWDELLPNVGFISNTKFTGGEITTYEFTNNKLSLVSETGRQWFTHPDSTLYRPYLSTFKRLMKNEDFQIFEKKYPHNDYPLPIYWDFNGLKIGIQERLQTREGVVGRVMALTFEKQ